MIKGKRDIDMKIVVGDYELMTVPRSLMTADGKLLPGHAGKAELIHETKRECGVISTDNIQTDSAVHVIDAMHRGTSKRVVSMCQ